MAPAKSRARGPARQSEENSAVNEIIDRVANDLGVDPLDLPPLYRAIDSDALDALLATSAETSEIQVTFKYAGCQVVVAKDTAVTAKGCPELDISVDGN